MPLLGARLCGRCWGHRGEQADRHSLSGIFSGFFRRALNWVSFSRRLSTWSFVTVGGNSPEHGGLQSGKEVGNYPNLTEKRRESCPRSLSFQYLESEFELGSVFIATWFSLGPLALCRWREPLKERLGALLGGR